ncbi:MAG: hypothetical protein U0414_02460 [Polyangiaceae bacterium]
MSAFREWASARDQASGEWECEYPNWAPLYSAAQRILSLETVSPAALADLLYALARDNEAEFILDCLGHAEPIGVAVATAGLRCDDAQARWQLAVFLGRCQCVSASTLLRAYLDDADEYVRRRALAAAVAIDRDYAESIAWSRLTDLHEYTRLAALQALADAQSPRLSAALEQLAADPSEHVRAAVDRVRARGPAPV